MNERVFMTGMGALNGSGLTLNESWEAILTGRSSLQSLTDEEFNDCEYARGGKISSYRPKELVKDKKLLKLLGRHDVYGLNAATQAVEDSGVIEYRDSLSDSAAFNDRFAVYVGSPGNKFYQQYDFMPLLAKTNDDMKAFASHLFEEVHPTWLLKILPNNVLAYTGIQYGFKGPNQNITNHAVSGLQAISEAYNAIHYGDADRAVVVAYDLAFEVQQLKYYGHLGILSDNDLKPFDASHDGTVLGEGACAVVLESEKSVKERQAKVYSEILSTATQSDAQGIFSVEDSADTLTLTIALALEKACVSPDDIGMITSHGNGNQQSDITESIAYQRLFKDTPITAFKWSMGHMLAASGLMDTLLTNKSLNTKMVPGIANLKSLARNSEGLCIRQDAQTPTSNLALIVNRGFGGLNAALVIKGCDEHR